jgi:hypothetical protein
LYPDTLPKRDCLTKHLAYFSTLFKVPKPMAGIRTIMAERFKLRGSQGFGCRRREHISTINVPVVYMVRYIETKYHGSETLDLCERCLIGSPTRFIGSKVSTLYRIINYESRSGKSKTYGFRGSGSRTV